jgi:hypothetical protein
MAKPSRAPGTDWFIEDAFGPVPLVVLKNGLHVANYCSHHNFDFDDGSTLMAVSRGRANSANFTPREAAMPSPYHKEVVDVQVRWALTAALRENLRILKVHEELDVLIVPTPILDALKNEEEEVGKCRVCWLVTRTPKICSSTKFIR